MKSNRSLSKNCIPVVEETPMYRNTPKRTAIGISLRSGDISTERPINTDTTTPDTRCSFTSMMCGLSPGACVLDMMVTEETCAIERTVAAQIHGAPKNPLPTFIMHRMTMSRWNPLPFFSLRSFLSIINLE